MTARLPDFIVAGVRKCGTTWLDRCLREHPEIFMPSATKELFFFDRYWSRGKDWYAGYFGECRAYQICGEVSPSYFASAEAPERIRSVVPKAKLIFVFRDPVERVVSLYHHLRARGDTALPLAEAIDTMPELLEEGFYARHLAAYRERFPDANIHSVILDDMEADPQTAFRALFNFIGADVRFKPATLNERSYVRREARLHGLARIASAASRKLHAMGLHRAVEFAKRAGAETLVLRKPKAKSEPLDPAIAARLYALYDLEIAELGRMLGRDLRALWTMERALSSGEADEPE
ncbi:MAG: sulfotransferase domain-containing protein [Rhizomicrobium sp.]